VQVHCDEGVANRIGPEPCVDVREDLGEASVGDRTGQPLSRERNLSRVPTPLLRRKARRSGTIARVSERLGVVGDPGTCGRSLSGNREIPSSDQRRPAALVRTGKARSRSR